MLTGLHSLSLSPFSQQPPVLASSVVVSSSSASSSSSSFLLPCGGRHVPVACLALVGVSELRTLVCGWPCGSAGVGSTLCRRHSDRGLGAGSVAKAVDHRSDAVVEASSSFPSSSMCVRSSSSSVRNSAPSASRPVSFSALVDDRPAFGVMSATHAGSCVGHPSQAAAPLMAQVILSL